ncbi:hypothetical protein [Ligilactobacillus salivarius]|uniref:hypothetical protein n=1 Tax=Ligilactobacillus salivarius TaxID=1624 RepID=UPI0013DE3C5A|nr:hypothetical protein [Ligilactobacillus salivarius]MDM8284733.1 hypothetical protein [Ligilactobacillus salivarius]QIG36540.1 hypothetical protein IBB3154_1051 [Ligilactobacillus salivarius]
MKEELLREIGQHFQLNELEIELMQKRINSKKAKLSLLLRQNKIKNIDKDIHGIKGKLK